MDETTVFVVEQSPRYRERIIEAVEQRDDMRLAGVAVDGLEALDAIGRLQPHVATIAVRLAGLGGIELVRAIVAAKLPTRGLVIGSPLGADIISDAIEAGAWGYVWKGQPGEIVAEAIAGVRGGDVYLGPRVRSDLFESVRQHASGYRLELSRRETEVLALIAEGRSSQQIAASLGMSVPTVKTHVSRAYAKLGVSDRAAAVAKAIRFGLLA